MAKIDHKIKPGDKCIHLSKYGGHNIVTVKHTGTIGTIANHGGTQYAYVVPYIVTDKGNTLMLDGEDGKVYKLYSLDTLGHNGVI
jgi:hypothetical protein